VTNSAAPAEAHVEGVVRGAGDADRVVGDQWTVVEGTGGAVGSGAGADRPDPGDVAGAEVAGRGADRHTGPGEVLGGGCGQALLEGGLVVERQVLGDQVGPGVGEGDLGLGVIEEGLAGAGEHQLGGGRLVVDDLQHGGPLIAVARIQDLDVGGQLAAGLGGGQAAHPVGDGPHHLAKREPRRASAELASTLTPRRSRSSRMAAVAGPVACTSRSSAPAVSTSMATPSDRADASAWLSARRPAIAART
jgi:hypothetical protein